jgi:hypothetical protein
MLARRGEKSQGGFIAPDVSPDHAPHDYFWAMVDATPEPGRRRH